MNLNFIAEHTADPESAKTFLRNLGILQPNLPVCNTWGQERSEVKKPLDRMAIPKTKKKQIWSRKGVFSKSMHKRARFNNFSVHVVSAGGAFYSDKILHRRMYVRTRA